MELKFWPRGAAEETPVSNMHASLRDVARQVREQFPNAVARLDQLDAHMATVSMVIDHIYEEDARSKGALP